MIPIKGLGRRPMINKPMIEIGVILGLYRDTGKGNGNYYLGFRVQCVDP